LKIVTFQKIVTSKFLKNDFFKKSLIGQKNFSPLFFLQMSYKSVKNFKPIEGILYNFWNGDTRCSNHLGSCASSSGYCLEGHKIIPILKNREHASYLIEKGIKLPSKKVKSKIYTDIYLDDKDKDKIFEKFGEASRCEECGLGYDHKKRGFDLGRGDRGKMKKIYDFVMAEKSNIEIMMNVVKKFTEEQKIFVKDCLEYFCLIEKIQSSSVEEDIRTYFEKIHSEKLKFKRYYNESF
jgi:hypothetical protein